MVDAHKNFAYSTVATAPSPATSGTSLVVGTGEGARFPAVPFNATISPANATPAQIASSSEIVRVTAIVSDTLTIVRAQEGTSARTVVVGDQIDATVTAKMLTDVEIASSIGSLTVIGHSYVAGTNYANTGTDYMEEVGMLAVLCGLLDISNENLTHHAVAGSLLTNPVNSSTTNFCGWAAALQFVHPNNSTHVGTALVSAVTPRSNPGLGLIVHGVNDLAGNFLEFGASGANGRNAWKHALRTVISRFRAGCLWCSKAPAGTISWDSIFTFTGSWTDTAGVNNTGAAVKKSSTNGDTVKVTLPADLLPGTYAFCFKAQQNGLTSLNGGITSGATTMTVAANAAFPQSGTFVAEIRAEGANTREEVLVTAGAGSNTWTITRARNGTSASAHGSGAVVRIASDTGNVAWSTNGSNATITGTTQLGGQGYAGAQVAVVQRFVLTAADAGKTITATIAGIVASDTSFQVQFDSFWMESPEPTPVVTMNVPRYAWGSAIAFADNANMNADTATVVAEFDGAVAVADVDSYIFNRGGVNASALGTTSPITITANDKNTFDTLMNASPFKPFRMSINGVEDVFVTGITYVSGSNYTLTVNRGYNSTTPSNQSGFTGLAMSWGELFALDNIHPNAYGHPWFAAQILTAIQSLSLSATQLARAAGNWTQNAKLPTLDAADTCYLYPNMNALPTAVAVAVQRVTYVPVFLPKECTIVEIGCVVTAFNAASTIALGIYDSDTSGQRPGAKLFDCGTISGNTPNGLKTITGLACRHRGGIVWLAFLQTGTAATVRCVPEDGLGAPFIPQATPNATYSQTIGYSQSGQATLPVSATPVEVAGAASTTNTVAAVHVRVRNTQFQ